MKRILLTILLASMLAFTPTAQASHGRNHALGGLAIVAGAIAAAVIASPPAVTETVVVQQPTPQVVYTTPPTSVYVPLDTAAQRAGTVVVQAPTQVQVSQPVIPTVVPSVIQTRPLPPPPPPRPIVVPPPAPIFFPHHHPHHNTPPPPRRHHHDR